MAKKCNFVKIDVTDTLSLLAAVVIISSMFWYAKTFTQYMSATVVLSSLIYGVYNITKIKHAANFITGLNALISLVLMGTFLLVYLSTFI